MNRFLILIPALLLTIAACDSQEKVMLFNGENLDNWTIHLPDSVDASEVFKVGNEAIYVGGVPNGYLRTKEEYSSYKLHVEWRWLEEPTNSGVLLHVTGEDLIWPNCIEAQLMAGKAGDFVLIGKGSGITVDDVDYVIESEENRYAVIEKMHESSEKPAGEWNTYEITVRENSIELVVNGILQNSGIKPTKASGNICLQSEGSPMEFRNIYLVPIQ